jgi:hypothetical protein
MLLLSAQLVAVERHLSSKKSPLKVPHVAVDGPKGCRRSSKFAAECSRGPPIKLLAAQRVVVDSLPSAAEQPACRGGR